MAKAVQATLGVRVVVFAFDPDPAAPPARALTVLVQSGQLPSADVERGERSLDSAVRAAAAVGVELGGRGRRAGAGPNLVGVDEEVGSPRALSLWYAATAPYSELSGGARFVPTGRTLRLDAGGTAAVRVAHDRLRAETRSVTGATALLGDVFTGDDLLRLHVALHGGPRSSERTFRRRVQELRDSGVLKPVRDTEVASLRLRVPRFRSPAGTGGRPPELLRYSGTGGEEEQLAGLRARRSA